MVQASTIASTPFSGSVMRAATSESLSAALRRMKRVRSRYVGRDGKTTRRRSFPERFPLAPSGEPRGGREAVEEGTATRSTGGMPRMRFASASIASPPHPCKRWQPNPLHTYPLHAMLPPFGEARSPIMTSIEKARPEAAAGPAEAVLQVERRDFVDLVPGGPRSACSRCAASIRSTPTSSTTSCAARTGSGTSATSG